MRARLGQFAAARPGLTARLRLFGLLCLLIVLFAGLQYMVGEGTPRVQVRVVSQDVPIFVPVERTVERVVERTVVVPVPVDATGTPGPASPTPTAQPTGTPTPAGANPSGAGVPSAGTGRPPGASGAGVPSTLPGGLTAVGAAPAAVAPTSSGPDLGVTGPGGGVSLPPVVSVGVPEPGFEVEGAAVVDVPEAPAVAVVVSVPRPLPVVRSNRTVIIATEDRLGVPGSVSSVRQVAVRVESRGRRSGGNGNGNDNATRSARNDGGGRTTSSAASAQPAAPSAGASTAQVGPPSGARANSSSAAQAYPTPAAPAGANGPVAAAPGTVGSAGDVHQMIAVDGGVHPSGGQVDRGVGAVRVAAEGGSGPPTKHAASQPASQSPSQSPPKAARPKPTPIQAADAGKPRMTLIPEPKGIKPAPEE